MPTDETTPLLQNDVTEDYSSHITNLNGNGTNMDNGLADEELSVHTPKPIHMAAIVIPMAIGIFFAAMDGTIVVSSYAAIGSELQQLQNASWISTSYLLTLTSFQSFYGKLSDIFGRKACLLFAYTIFAIGCLLCGLAQNMTQLIAARAFAGVGGGGMTTIVSIIMSDIVPLRSRGTWQGILNIVYASGSAAGAPIGGLIADGVGWRWSFLLQVPATTIAIIAVTFALNLPRSSESNIWAGFKRVDFLGACTLVLSIFCLLYGLGRGGNVSWSDRLTVCSLVTSSVLFILLCTIEMYLAKEPFAPKRIVVNRTLIAPYLVNFFGMGSAVTMIFHISLYFQAVQAKTAVEAGLLLLPSIGAGVVGSLAGGLIMQATGKFYWLTVAGYFSLFAGTNIITLTTGVVVHSFTGIAIGLAVASVGHGSGITTSLVSLIANAGAQDQAIATSVSYLFRSLGSVVALSIGSTLMQATLRSHLQERLSGVDAEEIIRRVRASLSYIDELDSATRSIVRSSYEEALHVTLWFTVILAGCSALFSFFIKEKQLTTH